MTGRNWGDPLIESHPTSGEPVAALAESWSASPDAKVWTFKIRKGVQFHDGKGLTVDDVVATLKRHSDENSQSGALGIMKSIRSEERRVGKACVRTGSTRWSQCH